MCPAKQRQSHYTERFKNITLDFVIQICRLYETTVDFKTPFKE